MISRGLEDPLWLVRAVITHAPASYVKKAVIDLVESYGREEVSSAFEAIDRLVQVSATGKYEPPEDHVHRASSEDGETIAEVVLNADGSLPDNLSKEDEETIKRFRDLLNGTPAGEDPFDLDFIPEDDDDQD